MFSLLGLFDELRQRFAWSCFTRSIAVLAFCSPVSTSLAEAPCRPTTTQNAPKTTGKTAAATVETSALKTVETTTSKTVKKASPIVKKATPTVETTTSKTIETTTSKSEVPSDGKTCASLIGAEICQGQLAYLQDSICNLNKETNQYEPRDYYALPREDTLVATVPDVERTPAGEAFDGAVEAIVTAFDERGFIRDHARLARHGAHGVSGQLAELDCPGLIVFRPSPNNFINDAQAQGKRQRAKFVLMVRENWHSGIAMKTLNHALELVEETQPLPPILGPYYSASADSLFGAVGAACDRRGFGAVECLTQLASGSMSSDFAIRRLQRIFSKFHPFVASQRERKEAVFRWRECKVKGVCAETAVQPSVAAAIKLMPATCDKDSEHRLDNYASLRLMGTTFGVKDTCFPFGKEVIFPGNVAALREEAEPKAHAEQSDAAAQSNKHSASPKPDDEDKDSGENSELIAWSDPEHSAQTFRVGLHEALRQTGSQDGGRIDTFWISNERIEDAIFLARLLKQELPDLRLIIDRGDLALLRTDYARELHGSLVIASWVPGLVSSGDPLRYTLSRDQAAGIYRAALSLTKDLAGSSSAPEDATPQLYVIARQRFFALTGSVPVRFPPSFVIILVLVVVLAYSDLARIIWLALPVTPKEDNLAVGHEVVVRDNGTAASERGGTRNLALWCSMFKSFFTSGVSVFDIPTSGLAYVSAFVLARLMLFSVVAQLAVLVGASWKYAAVDTGGLTQVILVVALLLALLFTLLGLRGAYQTARASVGRNSERSAAEASPTAKHTKSLRCKWTFWLAMSVVLLASTGIPCCLIWFQPDEEAFFARSLDLTGGASPIAVTVLCSLVLHSMGAFYARRLRILYRSYVESEHAALGQALLERVCPNTPPIQHLYRDAAWPRHTLTAVGLCVPLLTIVAYAPPFAAWSPGGFTLESRALHYYLLGCLIVLVFAIAFQLCQAWSLYRSLGNTLSRLAASELFEVFDKVAWPRTVTQHLWLNWGARVELVAALWLYRRSGARQLEQSYAALWEQVSFELNFSNEQARTKRAGLVVFELASWVRQLTSAMTSLTITIAGMLGLSWLYVFGVRRLLVTVSGFLTLCSVLLAIVMFTSLQHDEVMQRIGRKAPGEPALHPVAQRVVTFVVLPLLLLLTTYYPGWWEAPVDWLQTKVSAAK